MRKTRIIAIMLASLFATTALFAGGKKDKAAAPAKQAAKITGGPDAPGLWNFDAAQDTGGWYAAEGEFYAYTGKAELSYDGKTFGNGMLRLDVDFSPAGNQGDWSEPKIKTDIPPLPVGGYHKLTFDFYFNPANMTKGGFQTKVFANGGLDATGRIPSQGEDAGGGYVKTGATIKFNPPNASVEAITFSIVGSGTDYKGPIFIDNIEFAEGEPTDAEITKTPTSNPAKIDPASLKLAGSVALVDPKAIDPVKRLYAYLDAVGKSDYVLFGHQNDLHHKRGVFYEGSTTSDTKDITGSLAAVMGIDSLSFTGAEYPGVTKQYGPDPIKGSAALCLDAAKEGALITLSMHTPNFDVVYRKSARKAPWKLDGYTPNNTAGDVMRRILPGGDLNEPFKAYLDMIAQFAKILEAENIPVIFRPWHENTGSWFWWGTAFSTPEGFKNVWRYTVEYLRDVKNVHNFLYAYSPNSPLNSVEYYESRYAGDEYVDIVAFDQYQNDARPNDGWLDEFKKSVGIVDQMAKKHGKIAVCSETGIQVIPSAEGNICLADGAVPSWFTDVLNIISPSSLSYYLVWADFAGGDHYVPYKTSPTRGFKVMTDAFIDFYNNPKSIFANGTGFYQISAAPTAKAAGASQTGYILAPAGGVFLSDAYKLAKDTDTVKIVASVRNPAGDVSFRVATPKASLVIPAAKEAGGWYAGTITKAQLATLGAAAGTITLMDGGKALSALDLFFGSKPVRTDKSVADDFELYLGDNGMLRGEWSANSGPDCSNAISLSPTGKGSGDYGLEFKYRIVSNGGEGWTGEVMGLSADWSAFNALQLWMRGDGLKQKAVIQIKAAGEEFEVFLNEYPQFNQAKAFLITLPFSAFKGKSGGSLPACADSIQAIGLWVNTVPQGKALPWVVDSVFYYDDIRAVKTSKTQVTLE